jgi:hypothetical protein
MRFRHLQPIANGETYSHQGDLWQLGCRRYLGSLGRVVFPPATSDAPATAE